MLRAACGQSTRGCGPRQCRVDAELHRSGGGVGCPRVAAQSPLTRFLSAAPVTDGAGIGRKPLGSPMGEFLVRRNHRRRHLRILKASVKFGEVAWLPQRGIAITGAFQIRMTTSKVERTNS